MAINLEDTGKDLMGTQDFKEASDLDLEDTKAIQVDMGHFKVRAMEGMVLQDMGVIQGLGVHMAGLDMDPEEDYLL